MPKRPLTRRDFIGQASCAAVGSLGLLSTLLNLRMANSAVAQTLPGGEDYRALVCLFFAGGMDSYNLLVPAAATQHAVYTTTRGGIYDAATNEDGLALPRASLLPLAAAASDPFAFGVHPRAGDHAGTPGIQSLYNAGNLAFLANVGTLVEPTTKAAYSASLAKLPRSLYSHSDQVKQWHTSVATDVRRVGWAGLAADLLHAGNAPDARVSMNISLSGQNLWQTGRSVFNYTISSTGSTLPHDYASPYSAPVVGATSSTALRQAARTAAVESLMQQQHQHLLDQTYAQHTRDSIEGAAAFRDAFEESLVTTLFPGDANYPYPAGLTATTDPARNLSQQLKAVVRTIKMRQQLGLRRQTFFVSYGGWDHHDEVILSMDTMVDVVNRALASYWQALGEIGLQEQVTLYTASDFARTLTSNGAGSDHAWGGNAFVLGGAVQGGRVYGEYPDLALNGPRVVTSRGITLPSLAVEQYFAELALWLGVQRHQLADVLPRIGEFYSPGATPPVGFMRL